MCIKDSHVNEQSPVLEPCLSGSEKHICNFLMMKIIAVLFLFGFACGSSIPKPVHPNEDLIAAHTRNNQIRIIGGDNADITDHKWQASLQLNGGHRCGAVIISDYCAVTAAHCVEGINAGGLKIRVGSSTWKYGGMEYQVASFKMHENYTKGSGAYPNDIALLYFDEVITSDPNAAAAALSAGHTTLNNCKISGWGLTVGGNTNSIPDTLQEAPTIYEPDCKSFWGSNYNSKLHVCIYNDGNSGSCNGDSGGPLICNGLLEGVTSWGAWRCSTSYPSVYTRISTFRTWISENVEI